MAKLKLIDNQNPTPAANPSAVDVPKTSQAKTPLHDGANVNGMVPITETSHRGTDDIRNAASTAAAKAAQSMASADLKLPASDH